MKTYKIYFIDGTSVDVAENIIKVLHERITEGCKDWQIFSEGEDIPFLFLNLSKVSFIAKNGK